MSKPYWEDMFNCFRWIIACCVAGGLCFSCGTTGPTVIGERNRIYENITSEYFLVADAYLENKNYQKAVEFYTKASVNKNLTDLAEYKIAYTYALWEKWDEAAAGYKKLLDKEPDNFSLRSSLAYVYARQGYGDLAAQEYEVLLRDYEWDQSVLENYIVVLNSLENYELAEEKLSLLEEFFPESNKIESFRESIDKGLEAQQQVAEEKDGTESESPNDGENNTSDTDKNSDTDKADHQDGN